MTKADSFFDRLQFAGISAFFGLLIGVAVALVVLALSFAFVGPSAHFKPGLIYFSGTFFFVVGLIRGAEAAETVVDGVVGMLVALLGLVGIAGGGATVVDGEFGWRPTLWWLVAFVSGMTLVAWLA